MIENLAKRQIIFKYININFILKFSNANEITKLKLNKISLSLF